MNFINFIDYLGTFAFAISGIRLASAKRFDWFGAYVVGLVTAIGGGTTRDVFLQQTPFWMEQPSYLIVTALALSFVIVFGKYVIRLNNTIFIFDAIGLALFAVVGIHKTLQAGFPFWVAIVMGVVTGSVGGVIRDILINEVPLIFRKDIYALACVAGGICYLICYKSGFPGTITQILSALIVVLTRVLAVKYHWHVPVLRAYEDLLQDKKENDASN
ncbi:MAG: trimeric intracellular cation channel family protein [Paludibacteraceae bacterium]